MSAPSPERQAQAVGMAMFVALGALVVGWRARPRPEPPELAVVEVRGEVPSPGFYALAAPATVGAALAAAGAPQDSPDPTPVEQGLTVTLTDGQVGLTPSDAALTLGRPLDLNRASLAALEQLPGVGPARAAAIVADREDRGAFPTVDALDRVRGFGPATVDRLRPYLTVGELTPAR